MAKDNYCSYCGAKHSQRSFPKLCQNCGEETFANPIPVVVALLKVRSVGKTGYLLVRRGEEPKKGGLCFAGGHLELGEQWREGLSRELMEETGIKIPTNEIKLVKVVSSSSGHLLICGSCEMYIKDIPNFKPNKEVMELLVAYKQ